jgi:hypothetical protein
VEAMSKFIAEGRQTKAAMFHLLLAVLVSSVHLTGFRTGVKTVSYTLRVTPMRRQNLWPLTSRRGVKRPSRCGCICLMHRWRDSGPSAIRSAVRDHQGGQGAKSAVMLRRCVLGAGFVARAGCCAVAVSVKAEQQISDFARGNYRQIFLSLFYNARLTCPQKGSQK